MNAGEKWSKILADPTLSRLVARINRKYLWMGEEDLLYLCDEFEKAYKTITDRKEVL